MDPLLRRFIHFETDAGGGGDGGGEPAPEPAGEAAPEPAGDGGESWAPSREDFEGMQSTLAGLAPLAEALREMPPEALTGPQPGYADDRGGAGGELEFPDIYAPDGMQQLQAYLEQRDQRLMSQFAPTLERTVVSNMQEQLDGAWGQLPEDARTLGFGEEHHDAVYDTLVDVATSRLDPRLAADPRADLTPHFQRALQEASQQLTPLISAAKAQAVEEYKRSLQGGGDGEGEGPIEPAGGAGAGIEGVRPADSYEEIIERHLSPFR